MCDQPLSGFMQIFSLIVIRLMQWLISWSNMTTLTHRIYLLSIPVLSVSGRKGNSSTVSLRPAPAFYLVLPAQNINQATKVGTFCLPSQTPGDTVPSLLCDVRDLQGKKWLEDAVTAAHKETVCHDDKKLRLLMSNHYLSQRLVNIISYGYAHKGLHMPTGIVVCSTGEVLTSWVVFQGVCLTDTCADTTWVTLCAFTRRYHIDVAFLSPMGSEVLLLAAVHDGGGDGSSKPFCVIHSKDHSTVSWLSVRWNHSQVLHVTMRLAGWLFFCHLDPA